MSFDAHANFSYSTVATAPSPASSGTSLVVQAGDGTLFPAASFNATVWPAGVQPTADNAEIVRVTAKSTDTFTITRAQESSTARSIGVGDQIAATVTAKTLTDAEATAMVATTVGGLPNSPNDGQFAMLRCGSTPFDFIRIMYDATYGKWVTPEQAGKMVSATGISITSTSYIAYTASEQNVALFPLKVFLDAGLSLQIRTRVYHLTSGTGTGSLSARIHGATAGSADAVLLDVPLAVVSTTSATRIGGDSGWIDCSPTSADFMDFGLFTKVTTGTYSVLHASVNFRWVAAPS